jgi:hypothetical protein
MTDEDWFNFVAGGSPHVISVTRLPDELCRMIGCSNTLVRMEHSYALKCTHKHRLRPAYFPMLPIVIDLGFVISDRPGNLTFYFYEDVIFGGSLAATIKANRSGTELWVSTFHVASPKEAKRMSKKYRVIRPEKR